MAVIYHSVLPEGVPIEMLDAVTDEMDVDGNPPDGMLIHVHYEQDGRAQIVDVWDSQESYERFAEQRLDPAVDKVAGERGFARPTMGTDTTTVHDVHRVVLGKR
jgi:hypothetical protein